MGDRTSAGTTQPVTVTAARVVSPGHTSEFERWAGQMQQLVARFPGHLGSSLLRPGPGGNEYHLVYRFTDAAALEAWERSPERAEAVAGVQALVEDERYARADGLDSFFTVPPRSGPRWRMTALTVVAVFALSAVFQLMAGPLVGDWPWPLRSLLSAVFIVVSLGYVVMPRLTRWAGRWLRPAERSHPTAR
ncbi:antibiotic biosynthesis monooxygenase [Modestobacter sp. I12A-02628]|uniref:Antibiotic biosynthesis monooxygenase n=1 Tax=Goekera deserti TaxID=2497753 RepID=A0A7K3WIB6_9ACTN|nr:antibiotic biosynthesis monooxygenase [Goekera deserti]NDI50519.1 antibiotic biosynthesis monooxygenase [Goekera deserti]NEL56167.1 antibiotic biosynthesis monooxygenase [Goekera deserti]